MDDPAGAVLDSLLPGHTMLFRKQDLVPAGDTT